MISRLLSMPSLLPFGPDSAFPMLGPTSFASAVWPAANLGIYVPVPVYGPTLITRLFWVNGTAVGNGTADAALYDEAGTLIVKTVPATTAGASVIQSVDVPDTMIGAGTFYLALSMQSGSDSAFRATYGVAEVLRLFGLAQEASAHPLPLTATFAAMATAYIPLVGALTGPRTVV